MTTTIRRCKCASEYQDEQYGPGMRVFNSTGKDKDSAGWRCTVCLVKIPDPTAPYAGRRKLQDQQ